MSVFATHRRSEALEADAARRDDAAAPLKRDVRPSPEAPGTARPPLNRVVHATIERGSVDACSRDAILGRRSSLVWLALAAGVATTCGGGSPAGPASAVITSIAILGAPTAPISPGQSAQLTATATYSDGTVRDATSGVWWGTSAASVLVVSAAGVITAVAAGEAQVTATSSGVSGRATVRVSGFGGSDVLFQVAVLLSASRVPAPEDVTRVFARATDILLQKTGERMTQTDLVNVGPWLRVVAGDRIRERTRE